MLSAHNPAYWKMILFFAPILGATLIAGALTIDEFHNWYDVVAGAVIGTCTAFVAFRQTFASVWDFRFNHVLLPRTSSLFFKGGVNEVKEGEGVRLNGLNKPFYGYRSREFGEEVPPWALPVSREGGWNSLGREQIGAPFGASALIGIGSDNSNHRGLGTYDGTSGQIQSRPSHV